MDLLELGRRLRKVLVPPRLRVARRRLAGRAVRVLDVGCGNASCEITRAWLNVAAYHGIDREYYRGMQADYDKMDRVFFLDLDLLDFSTIEDGAYDLVIMNHVVEHLRHGEEAVAGLARKVRPGGIIYIETPSYRTYGFPSAEGFLNFYDDPTHWRCYSVERLADGLADAGFKILGLGFRRDLVRAALLGPVAILLNLLYYLPFKRKLLGSGLWDLLGVARYVVAERRVP
jgi:2-polyprenyl-3-methyl-5-hydroxy-6-metoxy-1,4-benzoquinol methylase